MVAPAVASTIGVEVDAMTLQWIREENARWDDDKARIVGGAPAGVFDRRYRELRAGDPVPGSWWRVVDGDRTVGYGWLDIAWGDGEILLATDLEARGRGVGSFALDRLEAEAHHRGLNYVYNVVRPTHPQREHVTRWLTARGFRASEDGSLLRAVARG